MVVDGCRWLSMVVDGCRWLSMVVDGCRWLSVLTKLYQLSLLISGLFPGQPLSQAQELKIQLASIRLTAGSSGVLRTRNGAKAGKIWGDYHYNLVLATCPLMCSPLPSRIQWQWKVRTSHCIGLLLLQLIPTSSASRGSSLANPTECGTRNAIGHP